MGPHNGEKLPGRQVIHHGGAELGNHVAGVLTHELRTDDLPGIAAGHQLHKAPARVLDDGAGVAEQGAFAGHGGDALLLGLGLGETHHGDLRGAVNAAGDHIQIRASLAAAHPLHAVRPLGRSHMGQLHGGGGIANGVHPGNAGAVVLIHQQALAVQRRIQVRGKQTVEIRTAANGTQDLFAGDGQLLALLLQMDAQALPRLLQGPDHGGGQHLHALLFQNLRQILAQLPVQLGQQIGHALHQRHPAAQVTVKGGKFHADDAAADDNDGGIGRVRPLQQLVGGHDPGQIQAGDGRADIHRAGGGQDALRRIRRPGAVRAGDADLTGGGDLRRALKHIHLRTLQQGEDAAPELLADAALKGEHLPHVVGESAVDAHRRAVCGVVVDLGGVEQGLGGDAAPIQAGAAHLPALHNGGVQPQLGGAQGGGIAPGTCADDQ